MNPEQTPYQYQSPAQAKGGIGKKQALLIGLLLLLLVILVVFLWPKAKPAPHKLVDTNLVYEENFGHLSGDNLYAYNGASFYKKDLSSGKIVHLLSGVKLPDPDNLFWADDKGVLATFSASFIATPIYEKLTTQGGFIDEFTSNYTWYVDFATGSVHQVSRVKAVRGDVAYSPSKNGFYYVPDWASFNQEFQGLHSGLGTAAQSLEFYDIGAKKNQTVIHDLKLLDVSNLSACEGYDICITGLEEDDAHQKLFGVKNDKLNKIFNSEGRLFATNKPDRFVTVPFEEQEAEFREPETDYHEEDVNFVAEPAYLRGYDSESLTELGLEVGNSDLITYLDEEGSFYALQPLGADVQPEDGTTAEYYAGTVGSGIGGPDVDTLTLEYRDGSLLEAGVSPIHSFGSGGNILLSTFDLDQVLLTKNDQVSSPFPADKNKADQVIKPCVDNHAKDSQYFETEKLYKVFFDYDNNFKKNIKDFSGCLANGNFDNVAAFNFYFGGLSPVNGRIVTD